MILQFWDSIHTGTSVAGRKKAEQTGKDEKGRTDIFSVHLTVTLTQYSPWELCSALGPSVVEGHQCPGECPEKGYNAGEGPRTHVLWGVSGVDFKLMGLFW